MHGFSQTALLLNIAYLTEIKKKPRCIPCVCMYYIDFIIPTEISPQFEKALENNYERKR